MFASAGRFLGGFSGVLMLVTLSHSTEVKPIKLRNEIIRTTSKSASFEDATPSARGQPTSGLFLIQFEGTLKDEWRAELKTLGVEFLSYVPEDAFIARIGSTPPGQLRRLAFVRWIGSYKPDHKIHRNLRVTASRRSSAGDTLDISILIAPRSQASSVEQVRNMLSDRGEETRLRQGTILRGRLPAARLQQLADSDTVLWIESAPQMKLYDEEASKIIGGDDGIRGTPTLTQQLGYDGSGVVVAVADSGLDSGNVLTMHPDLAGRVDGILFYGLVSDGADYHSHGTHVAGIIAGNAAIGETDEFGARYGLGVATGAHIVSQRIFNGAGGYTYPNSSFEPLTRDAVSAGADIGNNSWGDDTQGRYDLSAMEFDALVRDADLSTSGDQPYILEFSAGNAGPGMQTVGSPAVAKNVIATGATENNRFNLPIPEFTIYDSGQETMADFSSRGPCEDGRIKPDVVAPGTWIASLRSVYANDDYAWWPISDAYMYQGGTSQAGPGVSGAAAVFVQFYRANYGNMTPSPALVKAALINCAVDMDAELGDTGAVPNMDEGWGRVDLTGLIGSPLQHVFLDQSQLLTNGQVYEQRIVVADPSAPLKVTMAYTDVPGMPAAIPALVNDLDLEVVGPDGLLYRGNHFAGGNSTPGALPGDRVNNVEGVHFLNPQVGQYTIRVSGYNLIEDGLTNTPAIDQDFALVVSGGLIAPGESLVALDKGAYTAPAFIHLTVIDPDLAGAPLVPATISSSTEPGGEAIVLNADGTTGVFTGMVATVTGSATPDGQLQLSHDDAIQADYFDVSSGLTRSATAQGDLVAPLLSGVSAVGTFGRVEVTWQSDEPATSIVCYGTNATLAGAATNLARVTQHSITLDGLESGAAYSFLVSGADEAGNPATNDNGGSLYSFTAPTNANVLFVDGYNGFDGLDEFFIPRSTYTNALNQAGVSFQVWDINLLGSPTAVDLAPYPVVVWRLSSSLWWSLYGYDGLTASEQSALATYVANDGALFLSSMELLSQIGTSTAALDFRSNVLHVVNFTEDAGIDEVAGVVNDPVSSGMTALTLDYSAYEDSFILWDPNVSDTLTIREDATPIFLDSISGEIAGLRYPSVGQDSTGRVVFLSFPFDTVSGTDNAPTNRANLMRNVLSFLAPGLNGIGTITLDRSAYTVPGLVTVEMADSDLEGGGPAIVTFYSDTDPTGIVVMLQETAKPGLFRGTISLIPAASSPGPGELRAAEGDTLRAEYFDASNGGIVQALATVDTTRPVITDIAVEPGYQDVVVTWQTTEPSDSLIQFFESAAVERTAHNPALTTSHEVAATGLLPDRTYQFRVTSRDAAGNSTTVSTNESGMPLTFTTLTPVPLPWSDDMETGGLLWEVVSLPYTELNWTLGPPNNGLETAAHSPVNAWGCNLDGAQADYVESALVSPAIDLTSASSAELQFWHSYAFSEDISEAFEFGVLEIYTDVNGAGQTLVEYTGSSSGWEQEVVDLTPYVGQVVYLAWHYAYYRITFDPLDSPGWLVDDVQFTANTAIPGTVTVSNNLSQATFVLSGPKSFSGVGPVMTITNLSPGQYSVTFNPVPYYDTPTPQTNTLAESGTLTFTANYIFADSNTNSISDNWELAMLGGVTEIHPGSMDTDLDGASDFAEFVAGTDPTNAASVLAASLALQPNERLRLQWPTAPGRSYCLESTTNLIDWEIVMQWTRASGVSQAQLLSRPAVTTMYRVQVKP